MDCLEFICNLFKLLWCNERWASERARKIELPFMFLVLRILFGCSLASLNRFYSLTVGNYMHTQVSIIEQTLKSIVWRLSIIFTMKYKGMTSCYIHKKLVHRYIYLKCKERQSLSLSLCLFSVAFHLSLTIHSYLCQKKNKTFIAPDT